ncbi:MAG: hypothetical protein K2Y51_02920 [Gammaproteobacteria bacterium]|jgi:hypothetical protein|nr:hypothetical protein [Gammaproteobacteria bacterium]
MTPFVARAVAMLAEFEAAHAEAFTTFHPAQAVAMLDAQGEHGAYYDFPESLRVAWQAVGTRHGVRGFRALQGATMLRLIGDFERRAAGRDYTPAILERFAFSFNRIMTALENPSFTAYDIGGDLLYKDLALCAQKMYPAGAQVVEPASAFHRALLYRGGPRQFFACALFLLRTGGNFPWYQIHTHLLEREEFTPERWDDCYARIAGMLVRHPHVRGMWGGSWFYDPALETVSPRLAYLRTRPEQNGARVFYSNPDPHGGALATSETRRAMYERGEYLPKAYALLWPRAALIDWARREGRLTT